MVMMAETSPEAPYDVLRPVRCRRTQGGHTCNAKGDNIDWSRPQVVDWRCPKCKTQNVVVITEVVGADSATGPL